MTGLEVAIPGAFLAGLLSFLSPCVLPLVPPYLGFIGGLGHEQLQDSAAGARRARLVPAALAFVLGFTVVFVALGLAATVIGKAIAEYFRLLSVIAGVAILLLGLHFLGITRLALADRDLRFHGGGRPATLVGAFVVGLAFAFGWTPCVGPVLAAILLVAGGSGGTAEGGTLLAAYALGIGLPFVGAAWASDWFLRVVRNWRGRLRHVEWITGGLLVLTGLLFIAGVFHEIGIWLFETFPIFERIG